MPLSSSPPQLNFESEKEMFKLEMRQSIKQRRTKRRRRRRRRRFRPMCPKKGRILRRRNRREVDDLVSNLWVFGGGLEGNC